jgi:hypothetical protein
MAMMSDVGLPIDHVRAQVASTIDVIAHMAPDLPSGRRVILEVATVDGIHKGQSVLTPLFRFRHRLGTHGLFESTGVVPELALDGRIGPSGPPEEGCSVLVALTTERPARAGRGPLRAARGGVFGLGDP